MESVTLEELMRSGVHFGHQTKWWNPKIRPYIFTSRNGIYIIDLNKTIEGYEAACSYARSLAASGGSILFVGTKPQAKSIITQTALELGQPYVTERWLGGMMTNFETVRKSITRLKELDEMESDGTFEALSKKERHKLSKEKGRLEKNLGGIKDMGAPPEAIFIVDTRRERIALSEAAKIGMKVIAILDTNCDPTGIDYIIPGNDDAERGIELITKGIADSFRAGALEYQESKRAQEQERAKAKIEADQANGEDGADAPEPVESESVVGSGAEAASEQGEVKAEGS